MQHTAFTDVAPPPSLQPPGIPADEADRLSALYRLKLLDSPPSDAFDRIARMTRKALDVPIVLVSLVDKDRQWFKSAVGLDARQTSRRISFCGHVVFERRPLVINDATADPRFAANPLVTGPPHIRAYMGMPLFTLDRQPIGTLCAIDTLRRAFMPEETDTLREFAHILEDTLHAMELAAQSDSVLRYASGRERLFRDTFEHAAIGMIHMAADGRMHRTNQRAATLLGYTKAELLGIPFPALLDGDETAEHQRLFRQLIAHDIEDYQLDARFRARGAVIPVRVSVTRGNDPGEGGDYFIVTFG